MKWYGMDFKCSECKHELAIATFSYSADGEIRFHVLCQKCDITAEVILNSESLKLDALMKDIQDLNKVQAHRRALTPPVKAPVVSDKEWLHSMGIKEEDE